MIVQSPLDQARDEIELSKKNINQAIQRTTGSISKVEIVNVKKQYSSSQETLSGKATVGHEFSLKITGVNAKDCQLRWYEKTDVPYLPKQQFSVDGEYMKRDKWNNMYEITEGESDIFKPWNDIKDTTGSFDITIKDIPGIEIEKNENKSRTLQFRLIVEGSDGTEKVVEAIQEIDVKNGKVIKNRFDILNNDTEVSAGGYVGKKAPVYI